MEIKNGMYTWKGTETDSRISVKSTSVKISIISKSNSKSRRITL